MRQLTFLKYPALLATLATGTLAFPPAPHYTVYGIVRDQVGTTLDVEDASLLLPKDNEEISRTPIVAGLKLDQNFELDIRIDANKPNEGDPAYPRPRRHRASRRRRRHPRVEHQLHHRLQPRPRHRFNL